MSVRPSLFGGRTGSASPRNSHSSQSSGSEVDLREEMDCILYGDGVNPKHGNLVLIRNLRRDAEGCALRCQCSTDQITLESDPDCSYCYGEGYLWDESWAWAFWMYAGSDGGFVKRFQRISPGEVRVDYKVFFFRYDTNILYGDKIVEVKLDVDGEVELPYVREAIYKPQTLAKRRLDNGRVEYIAAFCREDDAIRTDNPQ